MNDASPGPAIASLDVPCDDRLPDFLIDDGHWLGDATALRGVILPDQGEARARGLLEMDVPRVYLGAAALLDSAMVERLVRSYGSERIGVYLPAARMEVSWSMETQSNADFKTVTPSHCDPAWEILDDDGGRTGTLVHWWLGAMFERGAGSAIVRVDIRDDSDLNLCATLAEFWGDKVWFAPRSIAGNDFAEWVRWGHAARLALPFATLAADPYFRRQQAPAAAACAGA